MKIAFIGLGNMGAPMARNLLKAGHELAAYDVLPRNVEALAKAGARPAGSIGEAVAGVDLVITMLPSSPHVRSVYDGEGGVFASAPRGVTLIDCSTIDPHTAREVGARAAERGHPMADAPVSGGTNGAEAGTLTFMVGADEALFARIEPVLAQMGRKIVRCGESGTGQVAKICNNMLLAISMIGVAEAMSLGASLGIDPKVLAGIINSSSGRCWSSDTYNPFPGVMDNVPAARGYTGGFGSDLMLKDLGLATDAAKQARQPVVLGAAAEQLYRLFSAQGSGGLDFSAIIGLFRRTS
ncbi:MAG: 3-hydroxyisobutyrate dehydrogenase [Gammaproteobacteria bacterium]|nr:3-hydroxyisobutyrate dehydrogenase [Gammaproteobacteria bacterium]